MNIDAFRCMRRGVQLSTLNKQDSPLLAPFEKRTTKMERALLLLHGFSSTPAVYRQFLPALSKDYDAILCPALTGHAADLEAFAAFKTADLFAQVEEITGTLIKVFDQVDILGLSLGGLLACHLSNHFPLHHLYLLAPALDLHLSINKVLKLAKALNWLGFSRVRSNAGNLYSSQYCEIAYRQLPLTAIIEILDLIQNFNFCPPSCPTDLFLGSHDKVVSSSAVETRFAGKENIKIHWLSNSAHVLPLDGDIEQILACIHQNVAADRIELIHP